MKKIAHNFSNKFRWKHMEGWFWIIAIIILAMTNPDNNQHYSLCLFKNLGFNFCPGCGLGHSISLFFRFRFIESFQAHPLGIVVLFFLLRRSYQLLIKPSINPNSINYEQSISSPSGD